ncbi:hypothetical protein WUBG_05037, partial [Wuchereria bancrofti]
MPRKISGKKVRKSKKGRKKELRDINYDIMAQLSVEENVTERLSSDSSGGSMESKSISKLSQPSTNLGSKTAKFILEEMIINASFSHSKENLTPQLDDKSASGNVSHETDNVTTTTTNTTITTTTTIDSVDNQKDDSISGIHNSE